jgi:hypothetical protein
MTGYCTILAPLLILACLGTLHNTEEIIVSCAYFEQKIAVLPIVITDRFIF